MVAYHISRQKQLCDHLKQRRPNWKSVLGRSEWQKIWSIVSSERTLIGCNFDRLESNGWKNRINIRELFRWQNSAFQKSKERFWDSFLDRNKHHKIMAHIDLFGAWTPRLESGSGLPKRLSLHLRHPQEIASIRREDPPGRNIGPRLEKGQNHHMFFWPLPQHPRGLIAGRTIIAFFTYNKYHHKIIYHA